MWGNTALSESGKTEKPSIGVTFRLMINGHFGLFFSTFPLLGTRPSHTPAQWIRGRGGIELSVVAGGDSPSGCNLRADMDACRVCAWSEIKATTALMFEVPKQ